MANLLGLPEWDFLPGTLASLPRMHSDQASLAVLNLLRGWRLGPPVSCRVATDVGQTRLPARSLGFDAMGYRGPAPLWYYMLKEAEAREGGDRLGPAGGRIVAEVLLGLLKGDPLSFVNGEPGWKPHLPSAETDQFTVSDLVKFATS